jgi:hypothetical protein
MGALEDSQNRQSGSRVRCWDPRPIYSVKNPKLLSGLMVTNIINSVCSEVNAGSLFFYFSRKGFGVLVLAGTLIAGDGHLPRGCTLRFVGHIASDFLSENSIESSRQVSFLFDIGGSRDRRHDPRTRRSWSILCRQHWQ